MSSVLPANRISRSDEVFGKIVLQIADGTFEVGCLLPAERQLADRLGVSRVVIREAAKKLEQQGLVSIHHGIGIRVTNDLSFPLQQTLSLAVPENRELLRQCAQARMFIEPELAASAAQRAIPSKIHRLQAIQEALVDGDEIEESVRQDMNFHEAIADLAGNKVLAVMLQSVAELGRISRGLTLAKFGVRRAREQHLRILSAIAAGDVGVARRAMKAHLQSAMVDLS